MGNEGEKSGPICTIVIGLNKMGLAANEKRAGRNSGVSIIVDKWCWRCKGFLNLHSIV